MNPRILVPALLLALSCPAGAIAAEPDPAEALALKTLFDSSFEENMRRFPEWATYRGDFRFNDRLTDGSPAAEAEADAAVRSRLERARAIRRERLSATDRVSLDVFISNLQRNIAIQPFAGYRGLRVSALGGSQSGFADLMLVVPMATREHAEQLLKRMAAFPRVMDEDIAAMRRSQAMGWLPAAAVLDRAIAQIDAQLALPPEKSPYLAPFGRLGEGIPPATRTELQATGRAAVDRDVLPALRRLRAYLADEARPKAPASGSLAGYPPGPAVYDILVRQMTTTNLTAVQVHAIGQRELTRLRAEMEGVMREVRFQGDFPAFVTELFTDPKFFYTTPEALLAGYRDIAKRIDVEMPRLFAELPRAPYGIRAMPSFRGPDAAEYYDSPARDGSRGGWFNANPAAVSKKPRWSMATLTAHEAVPGHHLQTARALEIKDLPEFRRSGWNPAFGEGWALYAETLGLEIGLYADPYDRFGHLQAQAHRAARLVVDTGIHSLSWSRQQAIDFMTERTGLHRDFVTAEVDRYTSWPGQALSYMIGQLKIRELRDRAQQQLGQRFDLRRFHNAVIDQGALPLDTLEKLIDDWIATEAARPAG